MTSVFRMAGGALAASAVLVAAQPAFADILQDNGFTHSYVAATVEPSIAGTQLVGAGGISVKYATTGKTFEAWCVDVNDWMQSSWNYTLVPGATYFNSAAKSAELGRLAANYLSYADGKTPLTGVTTTEASGAFQMAVWEMTNEKSGTYDIKSGTFTTVSTDSIANNTAQGWLTSNPATTPMAVWVWQSDGIRPNRSQDLMNFAPVPEPETWAMMAAGLGLMGFCVLRRKQA